MKTHKNSNTHQNNYSRKYMHNETNQQEITVRLKLYENCII